jgi:proteasome lid subunit RPN8/RPN11
MIELSAAVRAAIARHARDEYPDECVGLLVGQVADGIVSAEDVIVLENRWTADVPLSAAEHQHSRRDRFMLDPRDYLRADRAARARGRDIVGVYHSHPDHPAEPSERDRVGAQGVGASASFAFLIQSVTADDAGALRAWMLVDDGARFVEMAIAPR